MSVARSTRNAFARGPLGARITSNKITPTSGAVESPSSPPLAAIDSGPVSTTSRVSSRSGVTDNSSQRRGVPHTYKDYSNDQDINSFVRKKTGGVTQPFPEKLYEMLSAVNEPNVVGWLPHGRAFIVRKPKEFTATIMPRFFRQSKLTSFQRQLNLYGFRRLTQGADAGAYYHELFLRGRPQLSLRMQRQKVKGTGHKQPADAQTEPNFYAMPRLNFPDHHVDEVHSSSSSSQPFQHPVASITPSYIKETLGSMAYDDMSPGMRNLHGAANLLKNIAAGVPASSMRGASLGLGSEPSSSLLVPALLPKNSIQPEVTSAMAGMFPSSGSGSMSLLGRVNADVDLAVAEQRNRPSAFTWQSIQTTQKSSSPIVGRPPRHSPAMLDGDSGPMETKASQDISETGSKEV